MIYNIQNQKNKFYLSKTTLRKLKRIDEYFYILQIKTLIEDEYILLMKIKTDVYYIN